MPGAFNISVMQTYVVDYEAICNSRLVVTSKLIGKGKGKAKGKVVSVL
jgi:hypothetical protein